MKPERFDRTAVAGNISVNQQARKGITGTPKGRTRRTMPMTETLKSALRRLDSIRTGYVVRNLDGTAKTDGQTSKAIQRIYERADLPERDGAWHLLRHSFGAHAALFGVNPWTLMKWMGHKRIDETMLYVNFASDHQRSSAPEIQAVADMERDPDRRIVAMLGARGTVVALEGGGEKEVLRC
jgi:integrase